MTQANILALNIAEYQDIPKFTKETTHLELKKCTENGFRKLLEALEANPQIHSLKFLDNTCAAVIPLLEGNKTVTDLTITPAGFPALEGTINTTRILALTIMNYSSSTEQVDVQQILHEAPVRFLEAGDRVTVLNDPTSKLLLYKLSHDEYLASPKENDIARYMIEKLSQDSNGLFTNITRENATSIDAFIKLRSVGVSTEMIKDKFVASNAQELHQLELTPILLEILREYIDETPYPEAIAMVREFIEYNIHDKDTISKIMGFYIQKGLLAESKEILGIPEIEVDWLKLYKDFRTLPCDRLDDVELGKSGTLVVTTKTKFPISKEAAQHVILEAMTKSKTLEECLSENGIQRKGEQLIAQGEVKPEKLAQLEIYKEFAGIILQHLDMTHHPEYLATEFDHSGAMPRLSVELAIVMYNILKNSGSLEVSYIKEIKTMLLNEDRFSLEEGMKVVVDAIELAQPLCVLAQTNHELASQFLAQLSPQSPGATHEQSTLSTDADMRVVGKGASFMDEVEATTH